MSYTPPPLLKLDAAKYRTPKERLEFFAANGRYFTNNDITESRDHDLSASEFVYPVFRISNDFGTFNVLRLVYDNYYNPRYDKYFPLNKYASRLAALFDPVIYNSPNRPRNPDEWYNYAWYDTVDSTLGDFNFPVNPITEQEFMAKLSGLRLYAKVQTRAFEQIAEDSAKEVVQVGVNAAVSGLNAIPTELQIAAVLLAATGLGGYAYATTEKKSVAIGTFALIAIGGGAVVLVLENLKNKKN